MQVGFHGKLVQSTDLHAGRLVDNARSLAPTGAVKEVMLGRGRSWTEMLSQQRPQLTRRCYCDKSVTAGRPKAGAHLCSIYHKPNSAAHQGELARCARASAKDVFHTYIFQSSPNLIYHFHSTYHTIKDLRSRIR